MSIGQKINIFYIITVSYYDTAATAALTSFPFQTCHREKRLPSLSLRMNRCSGGVHLAADCISVCVGALLISHPSLGLLLVSASVLEGRRPPARGTPGTSRTIAVKEITTRTRGIESRAANDRSIGFHNHGEGPY